jgi:phenylalanyl-tRNA synthetase alpha chain
MTINQIKKQALSELEKIRNPLELEVFRVKYLGRKGELTAILRSLKDLPLEERKKIGENANKFRQELIGAIEEKCKKIENCKLKIENYKLDITAPGIKLPQGHLHPITKVLRQVEEIFGSMGFKVVEGPDIETEYYNFDVLNIPAEHPARDVWDTFWLKNGLLLRTHTSPMQARYMEKNNPPLRIIVPGRVFRYEATDASHSHTFYQIEGLMVDKEISVANFKAVIEEFLKRLFSKDIKIRLRPSYFPFTEPSFEVDVKGGKFKNWLEIMGAGMVHPNVFKAAGYNPADWQGFAFGMGLDRLSMIKYGISDIRLFYSGDLRFLKQF